jgi:hypothetical protein
LTTTDDLDDINAQLAAISPRILPAGLRVQYADPRDLVPRPINARDMTEPTMTQLVDNVAKVGALESVPLCVDLPDGRIGIVSGHHRIKAAIVSNIPAITVLVYDSLTEPEIIAKQLAHNSIEGTDNAQTLKTLFAQIADEPALVAEAHIDPALWAEPEAKAAPQGPAIDAAGAVKSVYLIFVPSQFEQIKAYAKSLFATRAADAIYVAHRDSFDDWLTALQEHAGSAEIEVVPTAIADMARLARQAHELGLAQPGNWTPLATLFPASGGAVPPEVADLIRQAIERLKASGDITSDNAWKALEYMAAEILNS